MTQALPRSLVHRLVLLNAMLSYLMGSMGFSIQLIKNDFGLTRVNAAWQTIGWAVALVMISIALISHGHRRSAPQTMRAGWAVVLFGILLYCASPDIYFSVPALALAASGSVIMGNTTTAILSSHSKFALKNMFRTTGFGLFMGSISPTVIGLTTQGDIPWRWTLGVSALIIGISAQILIPELETRPQINVEQNKIKWDKKYLSIILFAFLTITMEISLSAWAVDLLSDRGSAIKTAVLSATVAPYFIAITRIYFSTKSEHNLYSIWKFSVITITAGIAIIVFTTSPILTVAGLVIAAAGIGPCASIAIALASGNDQGADKGIAGFVIGMGVAIGTSPLIMGYLSENFGFSIAHLLLFLVLILTTLTFRRVMKDSSLADSSKIGILK